MGIIQSASAEISENMDLIPRISVGASYYKAWDGFNGVNENIQGWSTAETTYVLGGGLLLNGDNWFFDTSLETLPFTMTNDQYSGLEKDLYKTELAFSAGYRVYKDLYAIGGYRYGLIGEEMFEDTITQSGPFVGISINGLSMGDDLQDIFSVSFAVQFAEVEDSSAKEYGVVNSDDSLGFNMKFGYRRAGSPHSFALKYQQITSESDLVLNENQITLLYSLSLGSLI